MKLVVLKPAKLGKSRRIARYECSCGFKTSAESQIETFRRMNDEILDKARNTGVDFSIEDIDYSD